MASWMTYISCRSARAGMRCWPHTTPTLPRSANKWHHDPPSYSGQRPGSSSIPLLPSFWSILFQNKPLLTHSTATTPIQDTIISPLHNCKSLSVQTRARVVLFNSINKTISCLWLKPFSECPLQLKINSKIENQFTFPARGDMAPVYPSALIFCLCSPYFGHTRFLLSPAQSALLYLLCSLPAVLFPWLAGGRVLVIYTLAGPPPPSKAQHDRVSRKRPSLMPWSLMLYPTLCFLPSTYYYLK